MKKFYLGTAALVSLVALAMSSSVAMAKGGDDNPAVVSIDQTDSSNDVDANITNDSSNPVPVTVQGGTQTIVEYRYVGLASADPTDGRIEVAGSNTSLIGFAAMNKLCADDYGPAARVATINEAFFRDDSDQRDAWVVADGVDVYASEFTSGNPSKWAPVASSTGIRIGPIGAIPFGLIQAAQCGQYTQDSALFEGPVTRARGEIFIVGCDTLHPVACSAPTVIPLQ